jgi:hypothetical protein
MLASRRESTIRLTAMPELTAKPNIVPLAADDETARARRAAPEGRTLASICVTDLCR